MSEDDPIPAPAGNPARATGASSPTVGGSRPNEPPTSLGEEPDRRVLKRLRNGKRAWVYPGQVRTSTGYMYDRWQLPEAEPLPLAGLDYPRRDYFSPATHRPLGRWAVAMLRHLYALPPDAPLPFISEIAAALGAVKHDIDETWNQLVACGAIRTKYGRPAGTRSGKAWWRVVVLLETGCVLRTVNAPEDIVP